MQTHTHIYHYLDCPPAESTICLCEACREDYDAVHQVAYPIDIDEDPQPCCDPCDHCEVDHALAGYGILIDHYHED